jgi:hypothetical protein
MAITVGPFVNVPAPGDPIRSPWAQQLTRYVVNLPYVYMPSSTTMAVNPGANTTLTLTPAAGFVDPYTMITGGGLVVPTGYGGLWSVAMSVSLGSHASMKTCAAWIAVGATRYGMSSAVVSGTEGQNITAAATVVAAAGATISFAAFHGNSSGLLVGVQYLTAAFRGGNGGAPQ